MTDPTLEARVAKRIAKLWRHLTVTQIAVIIQGLSIILLAWFMHGCSGRCTDETCSAYRLHLTARKSGDGPSTCIDQRLVPPFCNVESGSSSTACRPDAYCSVDEQRFGGCPQDCDDFQALQREAMEGWMRCEQQLRDALAPIHDDPALAPLYNYDADCCAAEAL